MSSRNKQIKAGSIREKLVELCHTQWSGWMKYLFGKCVPYKPDNVQAEEGAMIIPKWAVERWLRQSETPYKHLSPKEQVSDRAEADRFIALLKEPCKDKLMAECPYCRRLFERPMPHKCKGGFRKNFHGLPWRAVVKRLAPCQECGRAGQTPARPCPACGGSELDIDEAFCAGDIPLCPICEERRRCGVGEKCPECQSKDQSKEKEKVETSDFVRKICEIIETVDGKNVHSICNKDILKLCELLEAEIKRADKTEKAHKSIHACYDAYKAIAENKVVEMADKIEQLQADED